MIDIEILRRKAKNGITFPKQTPKLVDLFGTKCIAIGFYRGEEKRILFIADEPNEDYLHDGSAVFEVTWFKGRCFWVHKDDITIKPVGGFYI